MIPGFYRSLAQVGMSFARLSVSYGREWSLPDLSEGGEALGRLRNRRYARAPAPGR
jgi:hypothetical protein